VPPAVARREYLVQMFSEPAAGFGPCGIASRAEALNGKTKNWTLDGQDALDQWGHILRLGGVVATPRCGNLAQAQGTHYVSLIWRVWASGVPSRGLMGASHCEPSSR